MSLRFDKRPDMAPVAEQEQVDSLEDRLQQVVGLFGGGSAADVERRHGRTSAEDVHAADSGEETLQALQSRLADMERRLGTQAAADGAAQSQARPSGRLAGGQSADATHEAVRNSGNGPPVHARQGWVHRADEGDATAGWDEAINGHRPAVAGGGLEGSAERADWQAHSKAVRRPFASDPERRQPEPRQSGEPTDRWARPAVGDARSAAARSSVEEQDALLWQVQMDLPLRGPRFYKRSAPAEICAHRIRLDRSFRYNRSICLHT